MKSLRLKCAGIVSAAAMLAPAAVFAVNPIASGLSNAATAAGISGGCASVDCLVTIIGNVLNVALGFVGIILLLYFLYAGFMWMTAGGDEDKVKDATTTIRNAVVGLAIVMVAFAVSSFIMTSLSAGLSGTGAVPGSITTNTTLPGTPAPTGPTAGSTVHTCSCTCNQTSGTSGLGIACTPVSPCSQTRTSSGVSSMGECDAACGTACSSVGTYAGPGSFVYNM